MVLNHAMTLTVVNPATEEPIAELEQAGVEETDLAVARARIGLPGVAGCCPGGPRPAATPSATLIEEQHEAALPARVGERRQADLRCAR
jgi:hypothetical protein